MSDGFGADGLACPRRTGEVEGQRQPGGMPFPKAPAVENEIVLRHLRQGGVERSPSSWRENHIVEGPARHYRFDGTASGYAEQPGEWHFAEPLLRSLAR